MRSWVRNYKLGFGFFVSHWFFNAYLLFQSKDSNLENLNSLVYYYLCQLENESYEFTSTGNTHKFESERKIEVCHDSNDNVEEVREQLLTFSKLCLTDDILPSLES